jgi:hypothetical protein
MVIRNLPSMDWRTSDDPIDTSSADDGHVPLAGAAAFSLAQRDHRRVELDPTLARQLQMARAAGQRFGMAFTVPTGDGVNE